MKNNTQARKTRQLARLVDELKLKSNDKSISFETIHQLKLRIKYLLQELVVFVDKQKLKRILGTFAVIFFGFAGTSQAQVFGPPVQNPFGLTLPPTATTYLLFPEFADLDNDGDLDILAGGYYSNFQYYENTGSATAPAFAAPVADPFGLTNIQFLAAPALADLDNDGDLDLIVGEYYGNLNFYLNVGTSAVPNFAAPISTPFGLTASYGFAFPTFVDLDNDGDMDLLVGDANSSQLYYENIGTASVPSFAAPVTNPFGIGTGYGVSAPEFADLDHDGDFDLLIGSYYGAFTYYENTGTASSPAFAVPVTDPFGLSATYNFNFPTAADLDNDGDVDILVGEYYGTFQYFKNIEINASINELAIEGSVNPNPVNDILHFDFETKVQRADFVNLAGQIVLSVENPTKNVDVSSLEPGMYIIQCQYQNAQKSTFKVQKL